jgi:hypothetical protein
MILRFWCHFAGNHPVAGPVWYRPSEAQGADSERYTKWLCNPLAFVARDSAACDRVLSQIEALRMGVVDRVLIAGDDTWITSTSAGIQVDIQTWVDHPEGRFSLAQFEAAVRGWRRLLTMPAEAASQFTIDLP